MSFKSKLPKRKFKEDELLQSQQKKFLTDLTGQDLPFLDEQLNSGFTAESDGFKEFTKEAENAFVEKSTDEEPIHEMKENSIEIDGFEELLKEDDENSNSLVFGFGGNEACNNAIEQILSEAEDKEVEGVKRRNTVDFVVENFFGENRPDLNFLASGVEFEDCKMLKNVLDDKKKIFEKKAKMHLMGCKVTRIGKTRKKIKKRGKGRLFRKKKMTEMRKLKKSLKSKIEILKVQKLRKKEELKKQGVGGDKEWLPETHHKKYLKYILHLFKKKNSKFNKKNKNTQEKDWKFAWVNFNEYIKTEDSISYFHQRVLNLPHRYIKKDLYDKLKFLKQKRKKKKIEEENSENEIHAMFVKQEMSNQVYLILYHFKNGENELNLEIDEISQICENKKGRVSDVRESEKLTQINTPDLGSPDLFNYEGNAVIGRNGILSPDGLENDEVFMKIEKGCEEEEGFGGMVEEPFKDFLDFGLEEEISARKVCRGVGRDGFNLEFDDFT